MENFQNIQKYAEQNTKAPGILISSPVLFLNKFQSS